MTGGHADFLAGTSDADGSCGASWAWGCGVAGKTRPSDADVRASLTSRGRGQRRTRDYCKVHHE